MSDFYDFKITLYIIELEADHSLNKTHIHETSMMGIRVKTQDNDGDFTLGATLTDLTSSLLGFSPSVNLSVRYLSCLSCPV